MITKITKRQWANVDWSMQDIAISNRTGVTRERVRQVRRSLGKPDPESKRRRLDSARKRAIKYLGNHPTATRIQLSSAIKCSLSTVHSLKLGQKCMRLPIHLVNFKLPNCMLDEIWGFRRISQIRYSHGFPAAFWDTQGRGVRASLMKSDPEFKEACNIEIEKAAFYQRSIR